MNITLRVRSAVFARQRLAQREQRGRRRLLQRAGAFVRTRARSLIGGARAGSQPRPAGQPPRAHVKGTFSLRNIQFAYDDATDSAVVGPVLAQRRRPLGPQLGGGQTGAALQQFGGLVQVRERRAGQAWTAAGRARPGQPTRTRAARFPSRPYMSRALADEAPKFAGLAFRLLEG